MQQGSSSESVEDTLDDLLREAAASDAAAEATRPSRAEEREIIAAGEPRRSRSRRALTLRQARWSRR